MRLCRPTAGYTEPMLRLGSLTAQLDVLAALASAGLAAPTPYVRPRLLGPEQPGPTRFTQLRHPCVEIQDGISYIPNDVELERGMLCHLVCNTNCYVQMRPTSSLCV